MASKPKPAEKNAVVPIKESAVAVATELPEHMRGMAGAGTESLTGADIEVSRIKLLQATSPEVLENDDYRPGHFMHTTTGQTFGREVEVVLVYADVRAILWRPMDTGGGILARTDDMRRWVPSGASFDVDLGKAAPGVKVKWETKSSVEESRLLEWGSFNPNDPSSQPAATRMYNVVAVLPEHLHLGPSVITLQRTAIKTARKLMGKLKMSPAPMFGLVFKMSSVQETNGTGQTFFNYRFEGNGFVTNPEMFAGFKDVYEQFRKEGLRIRDVEGLQDDEVGSGTVSDAKTIEGEARY